MEESPRAAKVSVFGDWGSAEDIVYSNWEESDFSIPVIKTRQDLKFLYGLDFGYATSYNAFIAVAIEPLTHTMWIFDEMYERGMTNLDIAKRLTEKGYAKEVITADAAEPKSIYELQQGFIEEVVEDGEIKNVRYSVPNIRAATKGPDSVSNGIARVQEYHIYVHPTCRNTILELNNYAYSKDKDGRLTDKPEKEFDHLCLTGDTLVAMADGSPRALQDVREGDTVMTKDGPASVSAWVCTSEHADVWRVYFDNGTILEGTKDHEIYLNGSKCPIGQAELGDVAECLDGSAVHVVRVVPNVARTDVYDITVEGVHQFYANGILVSNCDALRYALSMEILRGRGGVVEARGEDAPTHVSRVGSSTPELPVRAMGHIDYENITGPADVAPPKKRCMRVFSSIRSE